MTNADIARKWLEAHETEPIRTMARKLRESYPDNFKDLESARNSLNRVLGRSKTGHTHEKEPGHQSDRPKMPEPWPDDWSGPFDIPSGKTLALFDVHIPHHEPDAIEKALTWRKDFDQIVLMGDILNCQRLSQKFIPDQGAPSVYQEKLALGFFLDMLAWYDKPIYYYAGNHEERYWKFMASRIPELAEDPSLDFETYFGLKERGVEIVSYGRTVRLGKLHGYHGHEVSNNSPFSPEHPSSWLLKRTSVSSFCGHFHKSSETTLRRHDESVIAAWAVGCLCSLTPRYARRNQWNHGFAFIEHDESGNFEFHNKKILSGKVY